MAHDPALAFDLTVMRCSDKWRRMRMGKATRGSKEAEVQGAIAARLMYEET